VDRARVGQPERLGELGARHDLDRGAGQAGLRAREHRHQAERDVAQPRFQ
jgi:hypothetical protein